MEQFRRLVAQALPAAWVAAVRDGDAERVEQLAVGQDADAAIAVVAAHGWLTPDWPVEYGGRGLSGEDGSAIRRELYRWRIGSVRSAIGTAWVGPAILRYGSDAMRARLLPPIAADEDLWCQLFSEPEAGSDLASVRTSAVRDGDTWIVDGVKMWTSRASIASWGLALVRTDPEAPKHAGLTCFCIDMSGAGVQISPIKQMTGDAEFFETRLTGVEVPDELRLGEPGQGWEVVRAVLAFERSAGSGLGAAPPGSVVGRTIDELIEHWRGRLDEAQALRVVDMLIESDIIEMNNARVGVARSAGALLPARGAAFNKILQAEHTKRLQQLLVDLDGVRALAYDPAGDERSWVAPNIWAMLRVQAKTIAGGTSEVLRNQLAERALGLPRDRDPSRSVPWSQFLSSLRADGGVAIAAPDGGAASQRADGGVAAAPDGPQREAGR